MTGLRQAVRRLRTPGLDELREMELFSNASVAQLRQLARTVEFVPVPAGRAVIHEGARLAEFVVVVDGYLERRAGGRHVGLLHPGQWTDPGALMRHERAGESLVAVAPARVAILGLRQFLAALDEVDGFGRRLLTGAEVERPAAPRLGTLGRSGPRPLAAS